MPLLARTPPIQTLTAPVEQRVRHACWATLAIMAWGLLGTFLAPGQAFSPWHLADLAVPATLLALYWRRSRVAAIALPVYFVAVSAYQLFGLHQGIGYFQLAILGWFLLRGSRAIFESHRTQPASPSAVASDAG